MIGPSLTTEPEACLATFAAALVRGDRVTSEGGHIVKMESLRTYGNATMDIGYRSIANETRVRCFDLHRHDAITRVDETRSRRTRLGQATARTTRGATRASGRPSPKRGVFCRYGGAGLNVFTTKTMTSTEAETEISAASLELSTFLLALQPPRDIFRYALHRHLTASTAMTPCFPHRLPSHKRAQGTSRAHGLLP